MKRYSKLTMVLLALLSYVSLTALWGGIRLLLFGGEAFSLPDTLLNTTPFSTFVIPGFLLTFVIGGSSFIAVLLLLKQHHLRLEASAIAGFGLLIWIFTELFMLPNHQWIQIVYFVLAIFILILTMLILKKRN